MEIKIGRRSSEEKFIETSKVTIKAGDSEFVITVNQFGELIVNKDAFDGGIVIMPSVSNEIRIK